MMSLEERVDGDLRSWVEEIKDTTRPIWDSPIHLSYVEHGLNHSRRVLEYLENLLNISGAEKLSENELFVLIAGSYLHDIGMQFINFDEFGSLAEKIELNGHHVDNLTVEDKEKIRAHHHEISYQVISNSHKEPLNLRRKVRQRFKMEIANVSAGHRGDITHLENYSKFNNPMRVKSLAILLRMADELDMDKRRLKNDLGKYDQWKIPEKQIYHDLKSYFVTDVRISQEGHIQLSFQLPEPETQWDVVEFVINRELKNELTEPLPDLEEEKSIRDHLWDELQLKFRILPPNSDYISKKIFWQDIPGFVGNKLEFVKEEVEKREKRIIKNDLENLCAGLMKNKGFKPSDRAKKVFAELTDDLIELIMEEYPKIDESVISKKLLSRKNQDERG